MIKNRKLILMRHSEAEVPTLEGIDFNRNLSVKGMENTILVSIQLKKCNYIPQYIVFSNSHRTTQTADIICKSLHVNHLQYEEELYNCNKDVFWKILKKTSDQFETIMMIAHNPGISDFANELSHHYKCQGLKTSEALVIEFESKKWSDVKPYHSKIIDNFNAY